MNTIELHARQVALEEEMRGIGAVNYMRSLTKAQEKGTEVDLKPGQLLLKHCLAKLVPAITEWIESTRSGQARRHASVANWVEQFDPHLVALVALRRVINGISGKASPVTTAVGITQALVDELDHQQFKAQDKEAYKYAVKDAKERTSEGHKRTLMRTRQRKASIPMVEAPEDKLKIGMVLIEMIENHCGIIERVNLKEGTNNTKTYLSGTDEVREWLRKQHEHCAFLAPLWLPMLTQPLPWTSTHTGGYLTTRLSAIKTKNKAYLEELRNLGEAMEPVYSALNHLQETPWRVNRKVYEVMKHVWDKLGGDRAGLPAPQGKVLPEKPHESVTDEEVWKKYRKEMRETIEGNLHNMSKVAATTQKLWVAERFLNEDRFFYPHVMDWRGRAYPVPTFMTPQGDDVGRGLLEFADGKPLGEQGVAWLAVHVANTWGNDKVSFDERIQWVQDNEDLILSYAQDPLVNRGWMDADGPWCFLAACFEWAGYVAEGESWVSHVNVQMDGTCNGLQNFSAMMRDPVGGARVNLLPAPKPSDIYAVVAEEATRIIAAQAAQGHPEATALLGQVNRKLTKTNTMTVPYGVSEWGMRDQCVEVLKKGLEKGWFDLRGADLFATANYLGKVNHAAIGEVVAAATKAMDWLQEVATIVASQGLPVTWTSPIGLPVLQHYRRMLSKRVNFGAGGLQKFTLAILSEDLDKRKQAAGISPNFVHSCDASHMMMTVNLGALNGITAFSFIHDSFGSHAADMPVLTTVLRQAFVDLYSVDVLEKFREEIIAQIGDASLAAQIPPTPQRGELDLSLVLDSEYFFA
ncbi:DNA-directed RNA polymerase [Aquabacterium sp.]|uniref:DNA-directed RNA polymerase n=1 Tax=Aquabacterium sp. TaxID=1872578 RepID=UPI004038410E